METTVRGRHLFPADLGRGIARECGFQYGRQFDFGFHSGHEPLGRLLGAPLAGLAMLCLGDGCCDVGTSGVAQ